MNELNETYLLKYLRKECTDQEYAAINAWLEQAPQNRKILFELEMAFDFPQKEKNSQPELIDAALKKFMSRVEIDLKLNRRKILLRRITRASVAAVVMIAAVSAFMFKGVIIDDDIVVAVLKGDSVCEVCLPDGSKVWINESSTLKYSKSFSETDRNVYLDGEAYFEVVRNPASPFVVNSKLACVTVLGTTFNFMSKADASFVEATLIEGEIKIKGNNDEGQIVLLPGQQAEIDVASKRMTVKTMANARLNAVWHDNLIPFKEASISDIMKTLENFYNIDIVLSGNMNNSSLYSGVISKKDSIEKVLNALSYSIPMKYTISNNSIYIEPSQQR